MRHISIVALNVVAVFALCAVAASSASAHEILFELPAGQNYPVLFLSKAGPALFESEGGIKFKCTAVTNHGHIEDAHLGTVGIVFTGCSTKIIVTLKCQTSGAASGEIVLPNSLFHLGLEHTGTSSTVPALLFLLPVEGGEHKFTFECGGSAVVLTGDVLGLLEVLGGGRPVSGTQYSTALVSFKQSGGKQNSTEFLLSLTTPEDELMTGQHLTSGSSLFGTSGLGLEVDDMLDGFSSGTIGIIEEG